MEPCSTFVLAPSTISYTGQLRYSAPSSSECFLIVKILVGVFGLFRAGQSFSRWFGSFTSGLIFIRGAPIIDSHASRNHGYPGGIQERTYPYSWISTTEGIPQGSGSTFSVDFWMRYGKSRPTGLWGPCRTTRSSLHTSRACVRTNVHFQYQLS